MAISKKGKRIVILESQKYFWWIYDEWDQTEFDGIQTKIVPENQEFYIKYGINQNNESRYIVISLRENKTKIHLYCPKFENEEQILTNSGVKNILLWSKNQLKEKNKTLVQHAYKAKEGIIKSDKFDQIFTEINNVI